MAADESTTVRDRVADAGRDDSDVFTGEVDDTSRHVKARPVAIQSIAAGKGFTCARLLGGAVRCAGRNEISFHAVQGDQPEGSPITIDLGPAEGATGLAAGDLHVCAVVKGGRVKCWGDNGLGALGLPSVRFATQANEMGERLPSVDLGHDFGPVASISAGGGANCAISHTGQLKCWGANIDGRLGLGDARDRGKQLYDMGSTLPVIDVGKGRTVRAVAMGTRHTCALLDDARVKCWGAGRMLGLGDDKARGDRSNQMGDRLPYVDLGTGRTALSIAAGENATCAILDTGDVKCWGWNWQGKLGQLRDDHAAFRGDRPGEMGDRLPIVNLGAGRTAQAIAVNYGSSCAVLDTGQVKCWGYDYFAGNAPICCDAPPELMGDRLPSLDFGNVVRARSLDSSGEHTCVLFDDSRVKCWGVNSVGELATGDHAARAPKLKNMGEALPFANFGAAAN
jgi:alpha-tubulin suppressor-like RCC1 family protein